MYQTTIKIDNVSNYD